MIESLREFASDLWTGYYRPLGFSRSHIWSIGLEYAVRKLARKEIGNSYRAYTCAVVLATAVCGFATIDGRMRTGDEEFLLNDEERLRIVTRFTQWFHETWMASNREQYGPEDSIPAEHIARAVQFFVATEPWEQDLEMPPPEANVMADRL